MSKVEEFQHRVAAAIGEPQDRKMPEGRVVTLPDGFNGHTAKFYVEPLAASGDTVKLRCAEPGKEYMFTWREKSVVEAAIASQRTDGKMPEYQWTTEDCAAADAQGWNLFESHGDMVELQIQRDDEGGVFADNEAAAMHVQVMADVGDPVAIRAIQALIAAGSSQVALYALKVPEGKLPQRAVAPVVARFRADGAFNAANQRMRKGDRASSHPRRERRCRKPMQRCWRPLKVCVIRCRRTGARPRPVPK